MRFEMHGSPELRSEAVERFAMRAFDRALGRLGERVRGVLVRVRDVNGPRGGRDKVAHVEVALAHAGGFVVDARGDDVYGAIRQAASKTKRVVYRDQERRRAH